MKSATNATVGQICNRPSDCFMKSPYRIRCRRQEQLCQCHAKERIRLRAPDAFGFRAGFGLWPKDFGLSES